MQMLQAAFPILMMFGIFYFIILRPQAKKQREFQAMLAKLGKGDEVITRGGIIGKITGVSEDGLVVVEIQEKVRVRMLRSHIEGKWEGKVPQNVPQSNAA
jgi:preprotein translocase subunit YajC